MGLDAVELVMDVEEHFSIELSQPELDQVRTVQQFADLIASKLPTPSEPSGSFEPPCPSALRFYEVRRRLCAKLRVDRAAIRPSTPLESLIPRTNRRAILRSLREAGIGVSGLEPARGMEPIARVISLIGASLIAASVCCILWLAGAASISMLLLGPAMLGLIAVWVFAQSQIYGCFGSRFVPKCQTVGALVAIERPEYVPLRSGTRAAFERSVLERVRIIIARQIDVHVCEVTPELRFIEDLLF